MSREDFHIGDSVNFQNNIYDQVSTSKAIAAFNSYIFSQLLLYVGRYGADGVEGPMSVLTNEALAEYKFDEFQRFQQLDKNMTFHLERQVSTYSEVGFLLNILATEGAPLSATGAGATCVITVNDFTEDQDFSEAALVVSSLGDPGGERSAVLANRSRARPGAWITLDDLAATLPP